MAEQYWIGGFFIDLSRNQITQNKQSQTIPPKALAVLTYLAENQGKVVSHDALLTNVWHDTVVSPNTLQKSIAQLRKALGDDGKGQIFIKTHAKQGYSLECDVRWHDHLEALGTNSSEESTVNKIPVSETVSIADDSPEPAPSRFKLKAVMVAVVIIFLGIIGYQNLEPRQPPSITFDAIRSLTATDDKEFDATYTPDGQYIVFHRYLDKQCINKLWAKNISTGKESQLTEDWGAYGLHSFSKDGKSLVFLATEACDDSASQFSCYDLVSIDFEKALESPGQPRLLMQCKNSQLMKPIWMNNNRIALLQRKSIRWELISFSVSENKSIDLYDPDDGNIIDFAYSAKDDLIAVISFHDDGHQYIEMLETDGSILSSHQIRLPPEVPKFRPIHPNFSPLDNQLVFSTGRQLFTLSYEGSVAKVSLPFADKMVQPQFHPDGKRLLMLKGPYDSDIALLSFDDLSAQTTEAGVEQPLAYSIFERSTLGDDHAVFQPGGDLIAFWSERSGDEQLWISDGNGPHQISNFPIDALIRGIEWAKDGQSLLVSANYELTRVSLDSSLEPFPLAHPVVRLFQWDSEGNSALLLMRINGMLKLVKCDLETLEFKALLDEPVLHARETEDGRLIYKGHLWPILATRTCRGSAHPGFGQAGRKVQVVYSGRQCHLRPQRRESTVVLRSRHQ